MLSGSCVGACILTTLHPHQCMSNYKACSPRALRMDGHDYNTGQPPRTNPLAEVEDGDDSPDRALTPASRRCLKTKCEGEWVQVLEFA